MRDTSWKREHTRMVIAVVIVWGIALFRILSEA